MDYDHYTKPKLIDMLANLEREFANLKAVMESLPRSRDLRPESRKDPYALFEPFFDNPGSCLLLVNMSYRICFINSAAANLLDIQKPESFYYQNVFDLLKLKQALKLKENIDHSYVTGKKGKLKELKFLKPGGGSVKVKMSSYRVRFNGAPAVRLKLKPV